MRCIFCNKVEVTFPLVCDDCQDKEAQAELTSIYLKGNIDPESMKCRTCGMIYDCGSFCTYCGDRDPLDQGDLEDEEEYEF